MSEFDSVDIPITVNPEMAGDIADELEATGSVTLQVKENNAPSLVEQIRWQIENEQILTEITDDYKDNDSA